jgi:hypothetical protein
MLYYILAISILHFLEDYFEKETCIRRFIDRSGVFFINFRFFLHKRVVALM